MEEQKYQNIEITTFRFTARFIKRMRSQKIRFRTLSILLTLFSQNLTLKWYLWEEAEVVEVANIPAKVEESSLQQHEKKSAQQKTLKEKTAIDLDRPCRKGPSWKD